MAVLEEMKEEERRQMVVVVMRRLSVLRANRDRLRLQRVLRVLRVLMILLEQLKRRAVSSIDSRIHHQRQGQSTSQQQQWVPALAARRGCSASLQACLALLPHRLPLPHSQRRAPLCLLIQRLRTTRLHAQPRRLLRLALFASIPGLMWAPPPSLLQQQLALRLALRLA